MLSILLCPALPWGQGAITFMGTTHGPSQWSLACEWLLLDSQCWTYAWYPSSHAPSLSFFLVAEFIILVTIKRLGDVIEISGFSEKIVSDNISPTFVLGS